MPGEVSITIGDVVGAPGVLAGIVEGLCKVLEGGIASGSWNGNGRTLEK